jgi:hypothetical protein
MARLYRSLMEVCWALGMVVLVIGVAAKYSSVLIDRLGTEPRGILIFSGVLFLAAIATRAVGRTGIEPGR